jgi:endonuclease/exonuclease/phosphatase family metal-dependent hydrolase
MTRGTQGNTHSGALLARLGLVLCAATASACEARLVSAEPRVSQESQALSAPASPSHGPARRAWTTLRLASWNVEWLNRDEGKGPVKRTAADFERLAGYARRLDADVIALQEVDGPEAAQRLFDPARYAFHFAVGGGAQRAGFAYRRDLQVSVNPDVVALDVGGVRAGADLTVHTKSGPLHLLSVHLKSGCFDKPLSNGSNACNKLARQLPELERWIDERAAAGQWFAVLGDFNRRLFARRDEPFWTELDDAHPPEADLDSPTRGVPRRCWDNDARAAVDHLVFGRTLFTRVVPSSFEEVAFAPKDSAFRRVLSDHCPLRVSVRLD